MKTKLFALAIFAIAICALIPSAHATTTSCANSTWLNNEISMYNTTGNLVVSLIEPTKCPYGCDSVLNQCRQPKYNMWLGPVAEWGILGIVAFVILFILVVFKLSRR